MSNRQVDLQRQARRFANQLSTTLNGTVPNGIRLSVFLKRNGDVVIGNGVRKNNPLGAPIPLTISRSPARVCLILLHTLQIDEPSRFVITSQSAYVVSLRESGTHVITYDYSRKPPNRYPKAHLHLHGTSSSVQELLKLAGRHSDKLADLHFPVGGRRFRPCVEDLIEFCILERLVTPRATWQQTLELARERYRDNQLQAAASHRPGVAASGLRKLGWHVSEPQDDA